MHRYDLAHLSDSVLMRDLTALVAQDRSTTASLLAHIAEVDARRLYAPAGYSSMFAYCVEELRLSEDATARRIHAARAARKFPVLFEALAEGRLHLTAMFLLAPHLTRENASELIEASIHRPKLEIEAFLARRFPSPDRPTFVRALSSSGQHALEHVAFSTTAMSLGTPSRGSAPADAPDPVPLTNEHALEHVDSRDLQPERFLVQVTIPKSTHDKLRQAQALLSHAIPKGDVAQVLDRALDVLIRDLEKRKYGTAESSRSRASKAPSKRPRHIPMSVRRAVWERDQAQCTFVSSRGIRCRARRFLEFDHVTPVARGGTATVDGLRLRCRTHNQYEAERAFGSEFMKNQREKARVSARRQRAQARERNAAIEQSKDVLAGLRSLGCRLHQAQRAVELTGHLQGVTLEERMRAALQCISARGRVDTPSPP